MLASDADILFLDFETTGCSQGHNNRPWQLGAIRMNQLQLNRAESFSLLLNVPDHYPFNPYAPGRWASLRSQLAAAPDFVELWPQLAPWLTGRALSAHNAATERTVLKGYFPLHHFGPWLDTLVIARCAYPQLGSYKLEDIISELGLLPQVAELAPEREPHDALYDACACAVLLRHILRQEGWQQATVEALERLALPARGRRR